jgi:hypothetical protein
MASNVLLVRVLECPTKYAPTPPDGGKSHTTVRLVHVFVYGATVRKVLLLILSPRVSAPEETYSAGRHIFSRVDRRPVNPSWLPPT